MSHTEEEGFLAHPWRSSKTNKTKQQNLILTFFLGAPLTWTGLEGDLAKKCVVLQPGVYLETMSCSDEYYFLMEKNGMFFLSPTTPLEYTYILFENNYCYDDVSYTILAFM